MEYIIKEMRPDHWDQVRQIYLEGIVTGNATFETQAPDWEKWDAGHLKDCRLVAQSGEIILGWTALSPFSSREVYRGVASVSIYIGEKYRGSGVGKALLRELIKCSEQKGYWTLQASVFAKNFASLKLHQEAGFRVVGVREKIGSLNGIWHDTILLERRSHVVAWI
jgi:L-amino acid N-acyltransferase YncA